MTPQEKCEPLTDEEDRPHSDQPPFSEAMIARSQAMIAAILGPAVVAELERDVFDEMDELDRLDEENMSAADRAEAAIDRKEHLDPYDREPRW